MTKAFCPGKFVVANVPRAHLRALQIADQDVKTRQLLPYELKRTALLAIKLKVVPGRQKRPDTGVSKDMIT